MLLLGVGLERGRFCWPLWWCWWWWWCAGGGGGDGGGVLAVVVVVVPAAATTASIVCIVLPAADVDDECNHAARLFLVFVVVAVASSVQVYR